MSSIPQNNTHNLRLNQRIYMKVGFAKISLDYIITKEGNLHKFA